MANPEHVAKLREGVGPWNAWVQAAQDARPDLTGANLARLNLDGFVLDHADLRGADLRGASLKATFVGADLRGCNLNETVIRHLPQRNGVVISPANFFKADLEDADLVLATWEHVNLIGANLRNATLIHAIFRRCLVEGADLRGARMGLSILGDMDLSHALGLAEVKCVTESVVGIDTLYRSAGRIPASFLRGCGVPETIIAFAHSLTANPIEFYSSFISYSSKDNDLAERLHADLRAKGLRVWFAPEDLKIGDRFQQRIEESIRLYDKVMILLSENSVASPWVESEVEAGRERERREGRLVLFPIRVDDAVMDADAPWAADLRRQRHIGDFRNWKDHDQYQKALTRLLRDLKQDAQLNDEHD